jgi:hypothetical protein
LITGVPRLAYALTCRVRHNVPAVVSLIAATALAELISTDTAAELSGRAAIAETAKDVL